MDSRPSVIIPNIHSKNQKGSDNERQKPGLDTATHYEGVGVLPEGSTSTEIGDGTSSCLHVKTVGKDGSPTVSNAKPGPAPCQSISRMDGKQRIHATIANAKKIRDSVIETSASAAKGISGSSDSQVVDDMHPKKLPVRRQYRKGLPKSKELTLLLSKPLELNWIREVVFRSPGSSSTADTYYITPSGKKLRSLPQVAAYLDETKDTTLSISSFTFHKGRISESPNEIERYARSKKLPPNAKNVTGEAPASKQLHPDAASSSSWTRLGTEFVNRVQECCGVTPAEMFLGDERQSRQDDSHGPATVHREISSGNWMAAYDAHRNEENYDKCSQWKELHADGLTGVRYYPQDELQSLQLPLPYEGKRSSEGYSADYNVKCDAQNCLEPYGLHIWVECGGCGRWMHNVCIGLQPEQAHPDRVIYKCIFCQLHEPTLPSGSDKLY